MTDTSEANPAPRLCHVIRWADFEGYGFNLHSDKTRNGQFVGKIDDDSPAEAAGLKKGDRIVEVNGINVANENHKQVVERIKSIPNETRLLVVDTTTDAWYRAHKIVIRGTEKNVIYLRSPSSKDGTRSPAELSLEAELEEEISHPPVLPSSTPPTVTEALIGDRRSSIKPADTYSQIQKTTSVEVENHREPDPSHHRKSSSNSPQQPSELRRKSSAFENLLDPVQTEDHQTAVIPLNPPSGTVPEKRRKSGAFLPPVGPISHETYSKSTVSEEPETESPPEDNHNSDYLTTVTKQRQASIVHEDPVEKIDIRDILPPPPPELTQTPPQERKVYTGIDRASTEAIPVEGHSDKNKDEEDESIPETMKKEVYQENITIADDHHDVDHLASQLTGFAIAPTFDTRAPELANGHSEPRESVTSVKNGREANGEYIEERVVRSPAFPITDGGYNKEAMSEKVQVHQPGNMGNMTIEYNQHTEAKRIDSLSDDSGSRSLSSAENHSDKENGLQRHTEDELSFQGSKTPSPSPAVAARDITYVRSSITSSHSPSNGVSKSTDTAKAPERPPALAKPATPSYGSLGLNMSVQEMRATLSRQRKKDPRTQPMDLRKKHDLINNM